MNKTLLLRLAFIFIWSTTAVSTSETATGQEPTWIDSPIFGFESSDSSGDVYAYGGHSIRSVDVSNFETTLLGNFPDSTIACCVNLLDGTLLIAGTLDLEYGFVGRWKIENQSWVWRQDKFENPITAAGCNQRHCVVGDDLGVITRLQLLDGKLDWTKSIHSKAVTSIVLVGEENIASGDWSGKIVLSASSDGGEIRQFRQHQDAITSILELRSVGGARETSSVRKLVTASRDGTVRLWYPEQGRLVRFIQLSSPAVAMAVLADELVIVATSDGRLHQCDLGSAKVLSSRVAKENFSANEQPQHLRHISSIRVLTNGLLLIGDNIGNIATLSFDRQVAPNVP